MRSRIEKPRMIFGVRRFNAEYIFYSKFYLDYAIRIVQTAAPCYNLYSIIEKQRLKDAKNYCPLVFTKEGDAHDNYGSFNTYFSIVCGSYLHR